MHILIIPSWYSTKRNPIRGSFFLDQAVALARYGHQVGMLVPPSRFRTFHGLREIAANWYKAPEDVLITQDDGIPIYRLSWWGWKESFLPCLRVNLVQKIFERYCNDYGKPQVLHGHSILYGGYLAVNLGKLFDLPSMVTEHSSIFVNNMLQWGHDYIIDYTLEHADQVSAVGPSLANGLKKYTERDIELFGNIVDTSQFSLAQNNLTDTPFIVSTIGRLDSNKAQDILLKAFAKVFKGKDAKLIVVGNGNAYKDFVKLAQDLGLNEQVDFMGQLSREQVVEIIQNSHVVVSSSYIETFGVTLIEAMSCGVPVIATRSGGPESFIDADSGLLVPTGDVQAMADAMSDMWKNYATYEPEVIRDSVVKRFSETAVAQQLTEQYENLIS